MTEAQDSIPAWVTRALPPLSPPTDDGLPDDAIEPLWDEWWSDPYYFLALAWQQYAVGLPLDSGGAVSSVSTGAQTVSYNPPRPTGAGAGALARSDFYRSRARIRSVPSGPFVTDRSWDRVLGGPNIEHPTPSTRRAEALRVAATRSGIGDEEISDAVQYPVLTDTRGAVRVTQPPGPQQRWQPISEPVGLEVGKFIQDEESAQQDIGRASGQQREADQASDDPAWDQKGSR